MRAKINNDGGLQGHRYFNLKEILKLEILPDVKEIAEKLRDKTWK